MHKPAAPAMNAPTTDASSLADSKGAGSDAKSAKDTTSGGSGNGDNAVSEVVVTGVRASLSDALQQKRASPLIVESISSKDIGELPDVTIAEELNRLPGVNTTVDRGNASQASIRGEGPRLVLGLVNGREVASSEPDRNVRWEIFPSEAVGGVTVYKTQSADLIAGGVAGTIDIHTVRPLDYSGSDFVIRAGPVYYDGPKLPNYDPWGYRAAVEGVHKFNDTFGVALGASYQSQKNGYNSFQGWGYNTPYNGGSPTTFNGVTTSTPYGAQTEVDKLTETRGSLSASAQWKPNSDFELNFDVLYSEVRIDEFQDQQWYGRNGALGDYGVPNTYSSYTDVNNVIVAGTVPYSSVTNTFAHYIEDKDLFATGLNGMWRHENWLVKADLSYSEGRRHDTWDGIFSEVYPASTSFNTAANVSPTVSTVGNPVDPTAQTLPSYVPGESETERLNDRLTAFQLDATRDLQGSLFNSIQFGARVSTRTKEYLETEYFLAPITAALPSNLLTPFTAQGLNVPQLLDGPFGALAQAAYGGFKSSNANVEDILNPEDDSWHVHEYDEEEYLMTNFGHDVFGIPMKGNAGVRVVSVQTKSSGYESVNSGALTPDSVGHSYVDVLPSLNMTFNLEPNMLLRAAVGRVMARPPLDELRAGRTLYNTSPPPTGAAGNPTLNPFLANQVDLSWEWYWHKESLLAISPYYKDVTTYIGYKEQGEMIDGVEYQITGPFNGKGGTMDGVEITLQTPFYFLPPLFQHFGIYSNVALAQSTIKEFSPTNDPLPQVGFAKTTAEVDGYYSDGGFELRLAYKYHSPYTVIYGWNASQLTRLEAQSSLDFSSAFAFDRHYAIRLQVSNLTNTVSRYYWDNNPDEIARY
jgi:TonB-dependent receptor